MGVCSMMAHSPLPSKVATKTVVKSTATAVTPKASWVDMYKQTAPKPKAKPKAVIIQKKKNVFGWICERCTVENKPANQKCHMCAAPKPKKSKNKNKKMKKLMESKEEGKEPDDDRWTNNKCPCGSNKKYKKCCKKLEKHGYNSRDTHEYDYEHPEMKVLDQMNVAIDRAEQQIAHFKGKKADRLKMMRELDKVKNKRDALEKRIERERNRTIKWQNKQNKNQITINHTSNGYNRQHNNAVNKAMVAKTIAI